MPDHDALLSAIYATPDDDLPRLVFADWLEENGDPERAEFIRVECESARTDRTSPDYLPLLERSSRLLAAHSSRWFGEVADEEFARVIITERGFIDQVALSADRFSTSADAILTQAPLLRGLHITAADDWRAFFQTGELAGLRSLSFDDGLFTPAAAVELARSKHMWSFTDLDLARQPLGPEGAWAVASARLHRLERVSVHRCGIGDEGVRSLLEGPFRHLRDLDLSENDLTDATCRMIAAAVNFTRIENLALCRNHITGVGIAALASASHLSNLKSLNLYLNPIGPEGGRAIAASRFWTTLKGLNVTGCGVGVAAANDLRWVFGDKAITV